MEHLDVARVLGVLTVALASAKLLGLAAKWCGQPAVLGELIAGILLGTSVLGVVDTHSPVLHMFGELGVVILLFEIGLETDLRELLKVGGAAAVVAFVGVALPFVLGFATSRLLGLPSPAAIVCGAALTATSIGITARVLNDLGRLHDPEGQIILGAAVIDDIAGLVILTVVQKLEEGAAIEVGSILWIAGIAIGFVAATLVLGQWLVPPLFHLAERRFPEAVPLAALLLALGLAWLAHEVGSASIIGAFAAGLLLARTEHVRRIETGIAPLGHFFVPLFFIFVGAQVDVGVLNPFHAANWPVLEVGGLLLVAAVAGKYAAGYAPFWFKGNKKVVGVGMVPRGEVGLIFAQMGRATNVLDAGLFSAVTLMVMVTTLITPPWLRWLLPTRPSAAPPPKPHGIQDMG